MHQEKIPDIVAKIVRTNRLLLISQVVMAIAMILVVVLFSIKPQPILVVNQTGQALAVIDLNNPNLRNDTQIEASLSQFVTWFHSSNTATISEDTKNYLSLLSQDYLAKRTEELKSSGVYALVKESFFVSTTKIESVKIIKRGDFGNESWEAVVSSATKIEGDHNSSSHTAKFKDRIRFYLAPRTEINPLGIRDVTVL